MQYLIYCISATLEKSFHRQYETKYLDLACSHPPVLSGNVPVASVVGSDTTVGSRNVDFEDWNIKQFSRSVTNKCEK